MSTTSASRGKITYVSLTDECYTRIKDDILNNILPWGEQLDVAQIAEDFGVSRSPVVKAVERLAHERLVEIRPNKGSYVLTPTARDIDEVTELRIAVERLACALAYAKHYDQLLAMLDENEQQLSDHEAQQGEIPFGTFLEYDREFHLIFARLADNQRLMDVFEIVRNQAELFRTRTYLGPQTRRAIDRHQEVATHLRNQQLPEALNTLQEHIEEVRLDTLSTLT